MIKKQLRVEYEEAQIWQWTREDRVLLADFLAQLSPENLSATTLCPEWTVSDVAAHLLSMATNKSKVSARIVVVVFASAVPFPSIVTITW